MAKVTPVEALNFLRLGRMTGSIDLEQRAAQLLRALSRQVNDHPMGSVNNQPTVYVCEGYACKTPITELDALKAALE
jgi:uncharacterized protein YyaL (SSP411 family)